MPAVAGVDRMRVIRQKPSCLGDDVVMSCHGPGHSERVRSIWRSGIAPCEGRSVCWPRFPGSCRTRWSTLELKSAVLLNRSLFYSLHLSLQSGYLRSLRAIAIQRKQRWPKNDDADGRDDLIAGPVLVLLACGYCSSGRNTPRFLCKLRAGPIGIECWRDVCRCDVSRFGRAACS